MDTLTRGELASHGFCLRSNGELAEGAVLAELTELVLAAAAAVGAGRVCQLGGLAFLSVGRIGRPLHPPVAARLSEHAAGVRTALGCRLTDPQRGRALAAAVGWSQYFLTRTDVT
jgi:hypothetical protein